MPINALQNPVFQPAMRIITNISNGNPCIVTTSFPHQYKDLLIVRLDIPQGFGMQQANQLFGTVTVLSPTTFAIDIDTTLFQPWSVPANWPLNKQLAQSVPFAEDNSTLKNATRNVLRR